MSKPQLFRSGLGLLALLAPTAALAGDKVVVAPLVVNGVNDMLALNVTTLIASELDFQPSVDGVVELEERPGTLNAGCLSSTSCLKAIVNGNGGTALVTGIVSGGKGTIDVDLLLFDAAKGSIVRRKTWTLDSNPSSIADGMSPIIKELLTGAGKKEAAAAATPTADDFKPSPAAKSEEEDFEFDDSEDVARQEAAAKRRAEEEAAAKRKVEEEGRRKAEEEARRKAEEEARREEEERARQAEARRQAEDEARRKAEADARKRQEEETRKREADAQASRAAEARKREEAAKMSEMQEFDPSLISFGSAAGQITAEDIDAVIQFGAPTKATVEEVEPAPRRRAPDPDEEDLDEPAPKRTSTPSGTSSRSSNRDEEDLEDLDAPRGSKAASPKTPDPKKKSSTSDTKGGKVKKGEDEGRHAFTIRARGGYANYYSFHFAAGSFELAVPIVQTGLYISGGLGVYGVRRALPYELQVQTGQTHSWNVLYPITGGALYKFSVKGVAQPYAGADAVFCQYYKDEVGSEWAIGGRVRGGLDVMVHPNFGLNVDAALGMWSGRAFSFIEPTLKNAGFFPTLGAGVTGKF